MRHRIRKKTLNRSTKHRKALLHNLTRDLFLYGEIKTTQAKAKEIKRLADKLMFEAKKGTLESKRELHKFFGKRDVVNALCDKIAPVMKDRQSGFTTLAVLGKRRGDNSIMAKLELIAKPKNLGTFKKEQG